MIYYAEDDDNIRELVVYTLNRSGLAAAGQRSGADFLAECEKDLPDLALLDIMLPGMDGLEVLRKLRADPNTARLPVILVTAKGTEFDKVTGLDAGADDYIAKPFGMMELTARVRALLRRASPERDRVMAKGGVFLDPKKRTVTTGGQSVELTRKEFDLLRTLMENAGIVLDRDALLNVVWGYDYAGGTRTVDVHVQTLRQKLREAGALIRTVRGIGYSFGE